jgi:hypothetical protein
MKLPLNAPVQRGTTIPPYVPYRTFVNFLDGLKVGVPSHIDKSVLASYSGAMQSWLKASLRAMKLIDAQSVPQTALYDLAHSDGPARKLLLKELFEATYDPVRKLVELETTTPAKLESALNQLGASGETVKKCVSFLTAMARDAGVELSPHLLKHTRATAPRRSTRQHRPRNGAAVESLPGAQLRKPDELIDQYRPNWTAQLLEKFPSFDPAWPDDLKAKWFEGFERLMAAHKD